jgi:hypothetical protein
MPNYKEQAVTGTAWRRARMVQINNESNSVPTVTFVEEEITDLGGVVVHTDVENLSDDYSQNREIALLDPETFEPSGQTISEGLIYLALFSKYMALAAARDAA